MAIIVEQENKAEGNWGSILVWGVVFVVLILAVYYVFFKRPDLVELKTPDSFENIEELSSLVNLDPNDVINNRQFTSLQKYVEPLNVEAGSGRSNPFLSAF